MNIHTSELKQEHQNKLPLNKRHLRLIKRTVDICISLIIVVCLLLPLYLLSLILHIVRQQGKIFFEQERWGKDRKVFIIYKFRSLQRNCLQVDENGKLLQVSRDDPRVTKFGKFIRRRSLDEIPQFYNVVKGEMSIVGPRPHPIPMNEEYIDKIEGYNQRHSVRPGITGWAQVNGLRGEIKDISMMQKRVDLDIWYINNWSIRLDVKIFFKTIMNIIKGERNAY